MTQDGIFRVLNMRIDVIDEEIAYLFRVNPMSPFPGSTETLNLYANGRIVTLQEEREFIISVLRQMIQINNPS